jgi:hypothetical protein
MDGAVHRDWLARCQSRRMFVFARPRLKAGGALAIEERDESDADWRGEIFPQTCVPSRAPPARSEGSGSHANRDGPSAALECGVLPWAGLRPVSRVKWPLPRADRDDGADESIERSRDASLQTETIITKRLALQCDGMT